MSKRVNHTKLRASHVDARWPQDRVSYTVNPFSREARSTASAAHTSSPTTASAIQRASCPVALALTDTMPGVLMLSESIGCNLTTNPK